MTTSEDGSQSASLNGIQSPGSTKAPKFGMMIPNRIFVGGITGNTTEAELRQFFSTFGAIKDCKIITDRAGVSKGYGFVTFVQLEDAEKLVQKEGEHHLIFKDRKLNIGPAVRKQQAQTVTAIPQFPQIYAESPSPGTIVYANGLPYVLQNGLSMYHMPESYGVPGASQMVAPSYPMILPQQSNVAQSGYYQTPTGPAAALQMAGGAVSAHGWPFASYNSNVGMPVVSGSHVNMASAGQVAVGSASGLDQYIYPVQSIFSGQEVAPAHPTGLHYQRVDVGQLPVMDPVGNEGSLITESSIASGHHHHHHHPYVDMQRLAASALSANSAAMFAPVSKDNGNIFLTSNIQKASTQNYGLKRVLSMPQEMIQQSPSNSYSLYGLPPVKIFAGQDRQRIITQAVVGNSEIQMVPKTQS